MLRNLLTGRLVAAALATTALAAPLAAAGAKDAQFTIAVIPDTQNYMDYTHQKAEGFPFDAGDMFLEQMRYVAANVESAGGDIAFVTSLGDVWQHQTLAMDPGHAARGFRSVPSPLLQGAFAPTEKVRTVEMPKAHEGFSLIAGKVPFSVVPGNHDYDAMWTDSRHPPAADASIDTGKGMGILHVGGLNNFREVFGADTGFFKGKPWYVASHDGGADSAQIFEAGGYRFLHIGLQFDAPNASLAWAAEIVARYPGLPTIVSMHDFLNTQGERAANPAIDGHVIDPEDNNPQLIWEKFISQHDQIFMVLSGHQHAQAYRNDTNRFGHRVYQLLSDYQTRSQTAIDAGVKREGFLGIGDGWMRLMRFDMAKTVPAVTVTTYSTHYRKSSEQSADYARWYKAEEQPQLTDEAFRARDAFVIDLVDFRTRFGAGGR